MAKTTAFEAPYKHPGVVDAFAELRAVKGLRSPFFRGSRIARAHERAKLALIEEAARNPAFREFLGNYTHSVVSPRDELVPVVPGTPGAFVHGEILGSVPADRPGAFYLPDFMAPRTVTPTGEPERPVEEERRPAGHEAGTAETAKKLSPEEIAAKIRARQNASLPAEGGRIPEELGKMMKADWSRREESQSRPGIFKRIFGALR